MSRVIVGVLVSWAVGTEEMSAELDTSGEKATVVAESGLKWTCVSAEKGMAEGLVNCAEGTASAFVSCWGGGTVNPAEEETCGWWKQGRGCSRCV